MSTPGLPLRRATRWICNCRIQLGLNCSGWRYTSTWRKIFKENDIVLLKHKSNKTLPILTKPLRADSKISTERSRIATDDILGKRVRDLVQTAKGVEYRIHEPTLADYTDLSPRLVTPVYSQDAHLIVSLLDLHPSAPGADDRGGHDRLEIFEAGTGHGALTLNLARAIHGANATAPLIPSIEEEYQTTEVELQKEEQSVYDAWRANRRAIIHTLDQSETYSRHAQMTVKRFRQGMYWHNVDFHVDSIEDFLSQHTEPFLDHSILDLPNVHHYLGMVGKALKSNGSLVTWCPSITQINKCVELVKAQHMPLLLERVIEVGPGMGGGREWDVRIVKPRALSKVRVEVKPPESEEAVIQSAVESEEEVSDVEDSATQDAGWEMVCRPKVGIRSAGGGFIALWRKMERD